MRETENLLFDLKRIMEKTKLKAFEKNTSDLKSIIRQADSSGKAAWTAGQMLKLIKEKSLYKIRYKTFAKYVLEEFKINELTANTYIKIHERFNIKEIGSLIVSSLKVIAEIQHDQLRKKVVKAFASQKQIDFKVKEVLATVALLDKEKINYSQDEVTQLIKKVISQSKIEKEENKRKKSNLVKFGDKLISDKYPELQMRFELQPINEMGVVALFCIVFDWMRGISFQIGKHSMNFKSIKYVQTGFPDACIICSIDDKKKTNAELQIEFEYKSFEYLIHKHHLSERKCDLIICWEDNAKSNKDRAKSENVKRLPPIIELKDFIQTGKLILK